MNNKKKDAIILFLGAIGGFILCVAMVFLAINLIKFLNEVRKLEIIETTDVTEYIAELTYLDEGDTSSSFVLYPRTQVENMDIVRCYYYEEVGLFDTYYQMYMECRFTEEDYVAEVSRIEAIEIEHDGEVQKPIYTEERFLEPAYVAIFTKYDDYEYVLLDEENHRIVYIYNRIRDLTNGNIPDEYLPLSYGIQYANMDSGYNMYYFESVPVLGVEGYEKYDE